MTPDRFLLRALRANALFRGLSDPDLAQIAKGMIERRIQKGTTILEEGVSGDYLYLIQDGEVKVTKVSADGREKILEILVPGDFFGEMALLDEGPRSASVKATRPCVLLSLPSDEFLRLLRQNPDLSMEVIRVLSRRLRETDEQVRSLLFDRVGSRTRRALIHIAREPVPGDPRHRMTPAATHQQLADLVGTSRETVTRVIKELKDEGWLGQRGKRYLVPADES